MAQQSTNTSEYDLLEPGVYKLWVVNVNKKIVGDKYTSYIWEFEILDDKNPGRYYKPLLFPSKMRELLLALGGVESKPNKIDWDDEMVIGKKIICNLVHKEDKKGVMREEMCDICGLPEDDAKAASEERKAAMKDVQWEQ